MFGLICLWHLAVYPENTGKKTRQVDGECFFSGLKRTEMEEKSEHMLNVPLTKGESVHWYAAGLVFRAALGHGLCK